MKTTRLIVFAPLALIRLILILLLTAFFGVVGWIWIRISGFSRRMQNWSMKNWSRCILWICGIVIERNDIPDTGNFILMPNHRSYLDIFVVAALTPSSFVAKSELENWPFLKLGLKITNAIPVDRKDSRSLLNTMGKIRSSVTQGIPVTLFPEGTTFKGPLTKTFKNGSFKIAAESGIPVIPMAIHYRDVEDAWVDDSTFIGHFFRQMGKPVTKVYVRFGEPVTGMDFLELQRSIKDQIDNMLSRLQS